MNDTTVALAVAGDSDAFAAIVASYEPRIFRFLYGLLGDRELAQDLTQETFLSANRAIGRAEGSLSLAAWLHTIAKNHAYSHLRRRKLVSWLPLRRTPNDEEAEEDTLALVPDPAEKVALRATLREALAKLDADSRTMFLLISQGFSYAELGQVMGLTPVVIRQRIYRARERMRALCPDWEA